MHALCACCNTRIIGGTVSVPVAWMPPRHTVLLPHIALSQGQLVLWHKYVYLPDSKGLPCVGLASLLYVPMSCVASLCALQPDALYVSEYSMPEPIVLQAFASRFKQYLPGTPRPLGSTITYPCAL